MSLLIENAILALTLYLIAKHVTLYQSVPAVQPIPKPIYTTTHVFVILLHTIIVPKENVLAVQQYLKIAKSVLKLDINLNASCAIIIFLNIKLIRFVIIVHMQPFKTKMSKNAKFVANIVYNVLHLIIV